MTRKRKPRTQTTPKGVEIPVPKRKDVVRDLRQVALAQQPKRELPSPNDQSES